ncbi:MAG: hypothetical protein QM820_15580 [Minicystis sp.]
MKRFSAAVLFTAFVGACFAACNGAATGTFEGHPTYVPPATDDGSGPPPNATGVICNGPWDCDFWLCGCSDGEIVGVSICLNGFCIDASGACPEACSALGHGDFTGDAQGGPGSGIGAPPDEGGGGAGGAGGGGGGDCSVDGDSCGSNGDCCSGVCDGDGICGGSSCVSDGDGCSFDDECCAGVCSFDGVCGDGSSCFPSGDFCGSDDECCTGSCEADGLCL